MANEVAKSKEVELFHKWKTTQDPAHFQQLYGSMKNYIYSAAKRAAYGSNLPESAHKVYAAQAFLDALKTFDPKAGASIHTHVFNSVQNKVKRLNYLYGNIGHIPEPRMQAVGLYQTEHANLRDELNREPSAAELADRLSWGVSDVARIQKELRRDLELGEGTEEQAFFEGSKDEEILSYVYYELGPQEKVVYEYIFGKNGKPKLMRSRPGAKTVIDFGEIAKKTGMSESKVRQLFQTIRKTLGEALKK